MTFVSSGKSFLKFDSQMFLFLVTSFLLTAFEQYAHDKMGTLYPVQFRPTARQLCSMVPFTPGSFFDQVFFSFFRTKIEPALSGGALAAITFVIAASYFILEFSR